VRAGTIDLYTAIDIRTGKVIASLSLAHATPAGFSPADEKGGGRLSWQKDPCRARHATVHTLA
jgi:hypothetical protein